MKAILVAMALAVGTAAMAETEFKACDKELRKYTSGLRCYDRNDEGIVKIIKGTKKVIQTCSSDVLQKAISENAEWSCEDVEGRGVRITVPKVEDEEECAEGFVCV